MSRRAPAGALAALLLAGLGAATAARGTERAAFVTIYQRPATEDYLVYYDELRRERFLDSVADELNRVLELPAPVTLRLAECGHSTTTWDAAERTATLCYEFLDAVLVIAGDSGASGERREQLFSGAVTFALFAEIGRALTQLYALPAPHGAGRAGDEFAAITLASAERSGDTAAAAAVEFYDAALKQPDSGFEYLETHAFGRARLETVACLLYGNAPGNHGASLARGIVPAARAPRCAEELVAVATAWERALKDHTRTPAAAPAPAR
jgi:Putative metallopeptidase